MFSPATTLYLSSEKRSSGLSATLAIWHSPKSSPDPNSLKVRCEKPARLRSNQNQHSVFNPQLQTPRHPIENYFDLYYH
jgi:hypothetical protein